MLMELTFAWGLKSKSHKQEPRGGAGECKVRERRELRALLKRNESTIEELFTQNSEEHAPLILRDPRTKPRQHKTSQDAQQPMCGTNGLSCSLIWLFSE